MVKSSIRFLWRELLCLSILIGLSIGPAQAQQAAALTPIPQKQTGDGSLILPKVFHMAGIPGLKRNARGDLILNSRELIFKHGKKQPLVVPVERIRRVQVLSGERHYGKTTALAYIAGGAPGTLLLLKKRKVDTVVFDYLNERGGLMGMVIQVPQKQGEECKNWMARYGAVTEEPQPSSTMPTIK
jgi:hypothetical protein